jgi:hypothetical protein
MREISSAALHKLRRQGCDDDDLAVQEIELDIEQAEAMYGAITGEEMPSS